MTPALDIDIATEAPQWKAALPNADALAQGAAEAAWNRTGTADTGAELSIVLGDDALLRSLNSQFRDKDQPTNVLSFPAEDEARADMPRMLGDVILAFETIVREAAEQRKALTDHFQHLCVHGVLHLLGHDHQDDREAATMENLEITILSELGVANPYIDAPIKRPA